MRGSLTISFLLIYHFSSAQLHIQTNALVHVAEGANLEVGGNLENEGVVQNVGTITLYKNWVTNRNFNGLGGRLTFIGVDNQLAPAGTIETSELVINSLGNVQFPGVEYRVTDRLEFIFGNVIPGENTRFILGPDVQIMGGSRDSYFEGKLTHTGSGIKTFPLGYDGVYAPITLLDVFGATPEIQAGYVRENPEAPVPGDSVLGVSYKGLWELELISGTADDTQVEIQFDQEDLSDFKVFNNIRHRVNAPAVVLATHPGGPFESLGLSSLLNSDSLTYGTIIGKKSLTFSPGQKNYLAIGLTPRIPDQGLYYIPEAFSPQANDARNRTFRIFGEQIAEQGFELQIYNRYGVLVYETDSWTEANEVGWDGTNLQTGGDEPTGIYYYTVKFIFITGLPVQKSGIFYLIR